MVWEMLRNDLGHSNLGLAEGDPVDMVFSEQVVRTHPMAGRKGK
jgi:hypothetical protein